MPPKKIAMLTAGGLAPCLSSCVASLIETYTEELPDTEIYCYLNGFRSLPITDRIRVTPEMARQAHKLHLIGGSPIGNSRVSLDNPEDCYRRKLVPEGENPWFVACDALVRDGIEVIHPIGGDGTSIGASRLAHYSHQRHSGYKLSVIGLPKTIDNDIIPISQSLGAHTAAQEGATYFKNVVGENTATSYVLLVHEIMGRNCGYLAAETARVYREMLKDLVDLTGSDYKRDVHALYIPELEIDFESEVIRLSKIMKSIGCVNIFVSEGACLDMITEQIEKSGKDIERDPSGNIKLSKINVGQWLADNMGEKIGAQKSLVQKSGYFCRAAAADSYDRELIRKCCKVAVQEAVKGSIGIVGPNENNNGNVELIPLDKIKGGRKFDITKEWFQETLNEIGQNKKMRISRMVSLPSSYSTTDAPKEGLFVKKDNLWTRKNEMTNETNFAFAHSALIASSENEEYLILRVLKEVNFGDEDAEELKKVVVSLMVSFKVMASQISKAGVVGDENAKKNFDMLGLVAGETITRGLADIDSVKTIAIRCEKILETNKDKQTNLSFEIFCDPLDGASNINANVSTGSIFGIYRHLDDGSLQIGRKQLVSGYCLYGTAVVVVLGFRGKVLSFKLNPTQQKFELKDSKVRIPPMGDFYSANMGYYSEWDDNIHRFIDTCKKNKKKLRYIGSMVADIHRTLYYGGIFFYPENRQYPNGKLMLTVEANPIAFLIENAGGRAIVGNELVLDTKPTSLNMKVPFFAGSTGLVCEIEKMYN